MELDPLNYVTDGDGLTDGWEEMYQLDPKDNGLDNVATLTSSDSIIINGADGDPDNDLISNYQRVVEWFKPKRFQL